MTEKNEPNLESPEYYFNRELSWIRFNERVLHEGCDETVPLLERVKFLAIVSSNFDEFFMVRVAGLQQQLEAGRLGRDPSGMTCGEQLDAISERIHSVFNEHSNQVGNVFSLLRKHGINFVKSSDWTDDDRLYLAHYFGEQLQPIVTPLAIEDPESMPLLSSLRLFVALVLKCRHHKAEHGEPEDKLAMVPVPAVLPRFIHLPSREGYRLTTQEEAITAYATQLFPGYQIESAAAVRFTRDADVAIQDEEADDLLDNIEHVVRDRRRRRCVRMEISANAPEKLRLWLQNICKIDQKFIFQTNEIIDANCLWEIAGLSGYDNLREEDWPPCDSQDLIGDEEDTIWEILQKHDVLLFHPYEKYDAVVRLVSEAADDPKVLAIKQTLYRTSGDSSIVASLIRAAENGKEVSVLVELKARFDEERNIRWARRLEDAGCHVIYGVTGLKTHAKALLIVRRESSAIRRYVHLATGNYNERTARIYSDLGLMTSNRRITTDVASFFNLLTGYSETVGWSAMTVEPGRLADRVVNLIEREIRKHTPDQPGMIMAKFNSLEHPKIIQALYRASQAGVQIKLNVRGICMLKPGIEGVSENIEVRSIIDRYLEHARIYYFRNGGNEEIFLSSADLMRRNLEKRFETFFPIDSPILQRRLVDILDVYFSDNAKARKLLPDGRYVPIPKTKNAATVRAQELLHRKTAEASELSKGVKTRYTPLKAPQED